MKITGIKLAIIQLGIKKRKGAVHKRRHQSRGRGFAKRCTYFISLFSKNDDEGGGTIYQNLKMKGFTGISEVNTCAFKGKKCASITVVHINEISVILIKK